MMPIAVFISSWGSSHNIIMLIKAKWEHHDIKFILSTTDCSMSLDKYRITVNIIVGNFLKFITGLQKEESDEMKQVTENIGLQNNTDPGQIFEMECSKWNCYPFKVIMGHSVYSIAIFEWNLNKMLDCSKSKKGVQ